MACSENITPCIETTTPQPCPAIPYIDTGCTEIINSKCIKISSALDCIDVGVGTNLDDFFRKLDMKICSLEIPAPTPVAFTLQTCFKTIGELSDTATISDLLSSIQNKLCSHDNILINLENKVNAITTTPLVANDSSTIDFTTSGTLNHTLTAGIKVSATAGNSITVNSDGIYVPTPPAPANSLTVSADAGNKIETKGDGIYVAYTAQQIIDLIKNDSNFRTLVCEIMTECLGNCPNIIDVTTP